MNTTAAAAQLASQAGAAPKHRKARTRPAGSMPMHIWLGPDVLKTLHDTAEAIATITGKRESNAVMLRAGAEALLSCVKRVQADREHQPEGETSPLEYALKYQLARANFAGRN